MIKSMTDNSVILDLDETCLHTFKNIEDLEKLGILTDPRYIDLRRRIYVLNIVDLYEKGDGETIQMWGIIRPGLRKFLKFCFSYFKYVIVWSAGVTKYVNAAVDYIFKGFPRPHVVASRPECLNEGTEKDMILTKPITRLIELVPELKDKINLENTYIIDDRIDYVKFNFDNGIIIPPYNPSPTIHSLRVEDYALAKIMIWLIEPDIMFSKDIRKTKKNGNIFSLQMDKIYKFLDNYDKTNYYDMEDILLSQIQNRLIKINTINYPKSILVSSP